MVLLHSSCLSSQLFFSVVATDVYCKLSPNVSSEKIWVWTVMDFAEGELKNEQFALKFGQVERTCRIRRPSLLPIYQRVPERCFVELSR